MHWSFSGIFLLVLVVISISAAFTFDKLQAEEKLVTTKSVGFEGTTIIEFENNEASTANIDTIRMWLGSDFTFKSFKTEKGWTGKKTPQGVIVFTTSTPIKPGEVVKFGIKTDKPKPGINWKAFENDKQLGIGKTLVSDSISIEPTEQVSGTGTLQGRGILDQSIFRLVPEKPNVGSSMRVTGDNFGANKKLDFYIEKTKLESFETDDNGHFMITSKIPENQDPGRIDFIVKDSQGNEKSISLRIGESDDRMASLQEIPLTIGSTNPVVYRGEFIKVTGTGQPGGTVTATIKDLNGNILTTIAVDIGSDGNWEYETIIPPNAQLGKQTAEITDGTQTKLRTWTIESSKKIHINPTQLKFEPGETVSFNGTAIPNQELEVVVENPQGNEFYSEILDIDSSGEVYFEFLTEQSSLEGTYILFASQGDETEIILVGLGELPKVQLVAKMDRLNYDTGSTAIIGISGPPSATISLLIIDPSDKNKFTDTIILGLDGTASYDLDLTGYGSGVYTTVLTRGNAQTSDVFAVGLQTGSGPVEVRTTKNTYQRGESILILGSSGANVLIDLTLIDLNDEIVKEKQSFTNKDGIFSESSFRIPLDAEAGTWTIKAKSGPNFSIVEITVVGNIEEGLVVLIDRIEPATSGGGDFVYIKGFGAAVTQQVVLEIFSDDGVEIAELNIFTTGEGEFAVIWISQRDTPPGTYTVKARDPFSQAETTFVLE